MKNEDEFGYKARHILNEGVDSLDEKVVSRLSAARNKSLNHQRVTATHLTLAGIPHLMEVSFSTRTRSLAAAIALIIGATGTYYWNAFQQASEYEEIDSALLADELPPSAYLDRGFHAWLERGSHSPSQ